MQSQAISKGKVHTPDLAKDKRKGKELTVTLFVGGKQVEELTEEHLERMVQRLSKTMSNYYTAHADEYQKIN